MAGSDGTDGSDSANSIDGTDGTDSGDDHWRIKYKQQVQSLDIPLDSYRDPALETRI